MPCIYRLPPAVIFPDASNDPLVTPLVLAGLYDITSPTKILPSNWTDSWPGVELNVNN